MLSSSASRFDSLPEHPPTPPKGVSKAVDDALSFLEDSHQIERALNKSLVQRRPNLQAVVHSPSQQSTASTTSTSKRVGFSPHTTFHQLPVQYPLGSPARRLVKRSPSNKVTKPLKSILKATHAEPPTPDDLDSKLSYFSPDVPGSFAKMLQSVLSQLASQSTSNRLDAYITLNGALQAYNDLPDASALTQKLGLLTQFLSRDIAWKNTDGKPDQNIVMQALKLTNCLLFHEATAVELDNDFKCFLLDRSIVVMEASDTPKQIMKAHVHLLAHSKLQSSALNAARADKILTALQTIDQRCSGNNIIAARLIVYQRLLEQAPTLMLTRLRDWLEQTFHCMLSSIGDIRGRAIDTCTKGGVRLGVQGLAAKGLNDFLESETSEGPSYYEFFSARLFEMLANKELAPCVPRIWSAVVLFFRSKKKPLEKWTGFRKWLTIIQKCLNSSDVLVRYEATVAWNKLVYTTTFDLSLSPGMMRMLKTPIVSGIERRGQDAFSRQIRQYTLDCYCNLLHYSLRPGLTTDETEMAWQAFVEAILAPMAQTSPKGRVTACRILQGLVIGNAATWNQNVALMDSPLKPEDLTKLEPRWIRSHTASVLNILQPVAEASLWTANESHDALKSVWQALMQAISDAGAQEVKTSNDLKQAIALIVASLRRTWTRRSQQLSDSDSRVWLNNYIAFVQTTVAVLGPGHFIEEYLTTSEGDAIEVAPTPSMKRSKSQSLPQSPMVLLLKPFLAHDSESSPLDSVQSPALGSLLDLFVDSRPSTYAKAELLSRTFFALQSTEQSGEESLPENGALFDIVARSMISVFRSHQPDQQPQGSLGQCLRFAVDLLNAGITRASGPELTELLLPLYDAIFALAKHGAGEGAVVLSVMEPVSKALSECRSSVPLQSRVLMATHITSQALWPKNRQAMENARKSLWGVGLAPHKAGIFDPFDHVYSMLVDVMVSAYKQYAAAPATNLDTESSLFSTALSFLELAPISLLPTALRRTQGAFAVWTQDEDRKTAVQEGLAKQIASTWTSILQLVAKIPGADSNLLKSLEPLMVAGFASPHKRIVSETIVFWNAKFGKETALEYPVKLESVLRARVMDADIELPTFPDSNVEHVPATLPEFFDTESQDPNNVPATNQKPHPEPQTKAPLRDQRSQYFSAKASPLVGEPALSSTNDKRALTSGSSTPKARLRHDDSQIQFAPIDSSPIRFDDSQHLTEHQQEVKARQNEAAQMFPELSSSPLAQSTALPRALPKRLDFSDSRPAEDDGFDTPTALPDATGLMSDDMPSSPTPSSTKDAGQAAIETDDDQATEDELDEPPSSPPRSPLRNNVKSRAQTPKVGVDDTTVEVTDFILPAKEAVAGEQDLSAVRSSIPEQQAEQREDEIDIASDSILPTEQLQLEAEAAEGASRENAGEGDAAPTPMADDDANDITRVEDSFVGNVQDQGAANEEVEESPGSRRSSRKRKRTSSIGSITKKQKSASPFKRFISRIWPVSQPEDDEDIGEEIVVASSQRSQSPVSPRMPERTVSPSQPVGEPTTDITEVKQEAMAPPPPKRRGRPRKSATPTPSLSQHNEDMPRVRSLKRKASVLSNASDAETEASTSFVKDTPAVPKSRKGRKAQTASQGSQEESLQATMQSGGRATRRKVTAVMPSPPRIETDEAESADEPVAEIDAAVSTPQKADRQAVEERPKLTPKSILGRLRDALSDLVGMKINPGEAREFDDALYEIRREVHEAERRGRREE